MFKCVEQFIIKLEKLKVDNLHLAETGNFWDFSEVVFGKIGGQSYLGNIKNLKQLEYLKHIPGIAVRKDIR